MGGHNSHSQQLQDPDGVREDTVFISGLPADVDHDQIKSYFGVVGKIKCNQKSGMPMIWIFKDRGIPKGEAVVTYEDPSAAQTAIQWYSTQDFRGVRLSVKLATNSQRPNIQPPGGIGGPGGRGNGHMGNGIGGRGESSGGRGGRGGGGGFRGGRGNMRGGRGGHGGRPNDWSCPTCNNSNYHWRETCNRCQTPRPSGMGSLTDNKYEPSDSPPSAITSLTSSSSGRGGGFGGIRGGGAPGGMRGRGGSGGRGLGPLRGGSSHRGSRPQPY